MNAWQRVRCCVMAGFGVTLIWQASWAVETQQYTTSPNGTYLYVPSPEGPGIAGCDPSFFSCSFGIGGEFTVEYGDSTARFTNLNLVLSGNEVVQNNPPGGALVTADRVEAWLAGRVFELDSESALAAVYVDSEFPTFTMLSSPDGELSLTGGYNHTFFDGNAVHFDFTATVVPEPSAWATAIMTMLVLLPGWRSCRQRTQP